MLSEKKNKVFIEVTSWLSNNRFVLLYFFILYKASVHATNGLWLGDFWEHSAVVNALISDLINPGHPLFQIDAPHAFISPYSLCVAILARTFELNPVDALGISGLINLTLFFFGLYSYVGSLYLAKTTAVKESLNRQQNQITAFYSMLLIMFLWGTNPWGYSGFYYFDLIIFVLPYPSTFAAALSLIALSLNAKRLYLNKRNYYLIILSIVIIVLLSHPLTFIFLTLGLLIQPLFLTNRKIKKVSYQLLIISGLLAIAVLIAMQWPYYSVLDLSLNAGNIYHLSNKPIYSDFFRKTWLIFIALPLSLWAFKERSGQSSLLLVLVLLCVYAFGYVEEKYSFGRVITFVALLLQILIAEGVTRLELNACRKHPLLKYYLSLVLALILIGFSLPWLYATSMRAMTVVNSIWIGRPVSNQQSYKNLLFLQNYVKRDDLVLTDIKTSWLVPTIAGKVLAAQHPQAFIVDHQKRAEDLALIFNQNTQIEQRNLLIKKYQPRFILLDKNNKPLSKLIEDSMINNRMGKLIYENEQYLLFQVII